MTPVPLPPNHRQQMIDYAVELKKDQPLRSDETINQFLLEKFAQTLPKLTLYRHLKQAGATRLKLGVEPKCAAALARDQTNALWLGDFGIGQQFANTENKTENGTG